MELRTRIAALALVAAAAWPAMAQPARAQPEVRFSGPTTVEEGRGFAVSVEVSDAEGPAAWSWDLDGDGVFGEASGEATVQVPPGETDGPETRVFGVEAAGPSATTRAERRVAVRNLAPSFASGPPTAAAVGQPYFYAPSARDPAGAHDPLTLRLTSRPEGMQLEGSALDGWRIEWTPTIDQRGARAPVIVRVDDGDGGESAQQWAIDVAQNQPPPAPTPVSPIERLRVPPDVTLIAAFEADADGDPLVARFRLDRLVSFDGPEQLASPDVSVEGLEARWRVDGLGAGLWYWEVRAADADASSAPAYGQLVVVAEPADAGRPDASTLDGGLAPGGGACAVFAPGAASPPWLALGLAGALAIARRRPEV